MDLKIIVFLQFDSLYLWQASHVSEVPAVFFGIAKTAYANELISAELTSI